MSQNKVVFITGANTGLGLAIVRALYKSDSAYTLLVGSRDTSKGEAAIRDVQNEITSSKSSMHVVQVDLSSDASLEKAIELITRDFRRLDVLVNNGGVALDHDISLGKTGLRDAFNKSWDINVSGTHVLTTLAVPLLLQSADPRLMFMTSGTSSLTETERLDDELYKRLNGSPPAGWPKPTPQLASYRSSKAGLNMLMREWEKTLRNDGVKVWAISPGMLATDLGGVGPDALKKVCRTP